MRGAGWNPTRRNRNIGTSKSGTGQDNELRIPTSWHQDQVFWERLDNPVKITRAVHGRPITVLVEPTTSTFAHPCTVDDLFAMFLLLEPSVFDDLSLFMLRQPTRKEAALSSVWGRMSYFADIGLHAGPAVYLEAQQIGMRLKWGSSNTPDQKQETERLIEDGHRFVRNRQGHEYVLELDPCRTTQLFRTLLHEIGHFVHKQQSVDEVIASLPIDSPELDSVIDAYWSKPKAEKESFAHRYASEIASKLSTKGVIPFDRKVDEASMRADGLDPKWFMPK